MKKKTHSTQRKYFGTIPRSEFYGFVLGYALGLFLTGFLRLETQFQQILFAVAGLGIGYFIDQKYYREPDEPEGAASEQSLPAGSDGPQGALPDEISADGPTEPAPDVPEGAALPEGTAEELPDSAEGIPSER